MYGRGGCVVNSNKSIRKIDEQIQSLIDDENNFVNDNYKRNNSKKEELTKDDNLKTDTKKIQRIDYLETKENITDGATKKIDSLTSNLSISEKEFEKTKNITSIEDNGEDSFNITNIILIVIIVVLIFIIIFLIL